MLFGADPPIKVSETERRLADHPQSCARIRLSGVGTGVGKTAGT
jgi:hypothetical protein